MPSPTATRPGIDSSAGPVRSPCTSLCTMDAATGLCTGCARTLQEITQWAGYSDGQKRAVLLEVAERKAQRAAR